jgi:hypothetical protein
MVGFSEVHSSYSQIFHGFHFWSVFPQGGILIIVVVISVILNGSLGRLRNFVISRCHFNRVPPFLLRTTPHLHLLQVLHNLHSRRAKI